MAKIAGTPDGPFAFEGVAIRRDGKALEIPADAALCRCGGSKTKPFCDGSPWAIKFKDS